MTPHTVLLERTFLEALVDPGHAHHPTVVEQYVELVAGFERNEVRLRARHDHLAGIDGDRRRTLLAPVASIHVARQFHRQARRLALPAPVAELVDEDLAVTFVVVRRERIGRVATLHAVFDLVELPTPA